MQKFLLSAILSVFMALALVGLKQTVAPAGSTRGSLMVAEGGDPMPRPDMVREGGDPMPRPDAVREGGDPMPRPDAF